MDYVENTHEAADRVKGFLKKYGNTILTIILVGVIAIVGLQYWHKHQAKVGQQASITYENLLGMVVQKKEIQVQSIANDLITNYSGTPYASLASMVLAQQAVAKAKYAEAIKYLTWSIEHSKSKSIKAIAQIRLARVYIANKQAQKAIVTTTEVTAKPFMAQANTVQGDAYLSLKNKVKAKAAYQQALAEVDEKSPLYAYVEMKLYSI